MGDGASSVVGHLLGGLGLVPDIKLPDLRQVTPKEPNKPVLADTASYANTVKQSQVAAATAGGTIFGSPGDNRIGNNPNQPRKSLIGQ
jgi:hypothetical protein